MANLIDEHIKNLERLRDSQSGQLHALNSYELIILKAIQENYDDADDMINLTIAMAECQKLIQIQLQDHIETWAGAKELMRKRMAETEQRKLNKTDFTSTNF